MLDNKKGYDTMAYRHENTKEQMYVDLSRQILNVSSDSACQSCSLRTKRKGNPVLPKGNLRTEVVFVGEAPGTQEEDRGYPFVEEAPAGSMLTLAISKVFRKTRDDFFFMNTVNCRPPSTRAGSLNGKPTDEEIKCCNHYFKWFLNIIEPKVIVALGKFASNILTNDVKTSCGNRRENLYWYYQHPVISTWHPAYVVRNGKPDHTNETFVQFLNDLNLANKITKIQPNPLEDFKDACKELMSMEV